jgi:hypothetical protein
MALFAAKSMFFHAPVSHLLVTPKRAKAEQLSPLNQQLSPFLGFWVESLATLRARVCRLLIRESRNAESVF